MIVDNQWTDHGTMQVEEGTVAASTENHTTVVGTAPGFPHTPPTSPPAGRPHPDTPDDQPRRQLSAAAPVPYDYGGLMYSMSGSIPVQPRAVDNPHPRPTEAA